MTQHFALTIGGTPVLVPSDAKLPDHLVNPPSDLGSAMISNALTIFITAGIITAITVIVWSGINMITSDGDKQKFASAKARLTYALIGLATFLVSFFIINVIGYLFGISLLKVNV